jgi:hypothetical protein
MIRSYLAAISILILATLFLACPKKAPVVSESIKPLKQTLYTEKRVIKKTPEGYTVFDKKGIENR